MIPTLIVLSYLAMVLCIGIFAFRRARGGAEDFFLAERARASIFGLAVQYGSPATRRCSPLLVAALFWRRSTKWGALAVVISTAVTTIAQATMPPTATIYGFMPVVPMVIGSAVLMVVVSRLRSAPSTRTIERYFPAATGVAV